MADHTQVDEHKVEENRNAIISSPAVEVPATDPTTTTVAPEAAGAPAILEIVDAADGVGGGDDVMGGEEDAADEVRLFSLTVVVDQLLCLEGIVCIPSICITLQYQYFLKRAFSQGGMFHCMYVFSFVRPARCTGRP